MDVRDTAADKKKRRNPVWSDPASVRWCVVRTP